MKTKRTHERQLPGRWKSLLPAMSRGLTGPGLFLACWLALLAGIAACSSNDSANRADGGDTGVCDPTTTPIVFAHGVLELGDAFASQSMRFASNGYCLDRIYAFDWNTVGFSFGDEIERLGAFIDAVLAETGADQVHLIGHSMGTFLSQAYLEADAANAEKVARYAGLAGTSSARLPGGVPSMAISSPDDAVAGVSSIEGGENVILPGLDHLQVTTSEETFRCLYAFFNEGREPRTVSIAPSGEVVLSGKLLTFAENQPAADVEMSIYPVNAETGERLQAEPAATFVSGADGSWGPFQALPGQQYEYEIRQSDPFWKPIHYYREPLPRTCDLVYFRVFPPPTTLFGFVLGLLVNSNPEGMVLASLNINQAVIDTRDSLEVGGYNISIPEVTAASKTTIAIFYTDFQGTQAGEVPAFNDFMIFIQGFDLIVDTSAPATVPIVFNGRPVSVRNWKSGTDGIAIAVFE